MAQVLAYEKDAMCDEIYKELQDSREHMKVSTCINDMIAFVVIIDYTNRSCSSCSMVYCIAQVLGLIEPADVTELFDQCKASVRTWLDEQHGLCCWCSDESATALKLSPDDKKWLDHERTSLLQAMTNSPLARDVSISDVSEVNQMIRC
jgi:hypothetical protein